MDGNGRWASTRGLPRVAGHRAGAEALRRAVEAAPEHDDCVAAARASGRPVKDVWSAALAALHAGDRSP